MEDRKETLKSLGWPDELINAFGEDYETEPYAIVDPIYTAHEMMPDQTSIVFNSSTFTPAQSDNLVTTTNS